MSNILPSTTAMPTISLSELAKHNTAESAWISINNIVYDVTKFAPLHPAGRKILLEQCGKDASDLFKQFHSMDILKHKYGALRIGVIEGTTQQPQLSIPYAE
jgi:L-lactate dehydrogenase (cytochrome)